VSCHSVAVVLTIVQTKQIRINISKRNNTNNTVEKIQNTVNTSIHTLKNPHIQHPHNTKQIKTTTVQDIPK
jgi:hypothetical protein